MKDITKKILLTACLLWAGACATFAMTSAKKNIPDTSGEYVFYRDASFTRESYVGFLCYDQSTYQARYYAPSTAELPAKNIEVLFSVKVDADKGVELTGERFIVPPLPEDFEIVNYIHDLVYELSARRNLAGELPPTDYTGNSKSRRPFLDEGKRILDKYEQFGGNVAMVYDEAIPIFNLKKIIDYAGKSVLYVVTTGRIADSNDKGFSQFVPLAEVTEGVGKSADKHGATSGVGRTGAASNNAPAAQKIKPAKKSLILHTAKIGGRDFTQSLQAEENWQQKSDSLWTLGDDALVVIGAIPLSAETARQDKNIVATQIIRRLAQSSGESYCDWSALEVNALGDTIKISATAYNPKSGAVVKDIKMVGRAAANFYGLLSFTAFEKSYQKNRGYYERIIKSYSFGF